MAKKIIYIPLDERPCNLAYPMRLFKQSEALEVVYPAKDLLGNKKSSADLEGIRQFILDEAVDADLLIFSTEMVAYGGLLPSRIYKVGEEKLTVTEYVDFVKQIKTVNADLTIYVSNLIMRTPRYSSGDEEPDYYEEFGADIFRYGWLSDQESRETLTQEEFTEMETLQKKVPLVYINDYEARRAANLKVNLANIQLVKQGVIDYLIIPQDDSAPYGYTAKDQAVVYPTIKKERLQNRVAVYPGADEAGYTLLARAMQKLKQYQYKIYPFFASDIGKVQIPLYEDRPLIESLKSHILATGALLVDSSEEADIVLAVNTPGRQMIEASQQLAKPNMTYDTCRNLRSFVNSIEHYLKQGKVVAVADSAYANGADLELISMLDEQNLITKLAAYRGWNTNCNTLGSVIGTAVIQADLPQAAKLTEILKALLDDGFYQAIVRGAVTDHWLPERGLNYFDLKNQAAAVATHVEQALVELATDYLRVTLSGANQLQPQVKFPWNRMFEIECTFMNLEE